MYPIMIDGILNDQYRFIDLILSSFIDFPIKTFFLSATVSEK